MNQQQQYGMNNQQQRMNPQQQQQMYNPMMNQQMYNPQQQMMNQQQRYNPQQQPMMNPQQQQMMNPQQQQQQMMNNPQQRMMMNQPQQQQTGVRQPQMQNQGMMNQPMNQFNMMMNMGGGQTQTQPQQQQQQQKVSQPQQPNMMMNMGNASQFQQQQQQQQQSQPQQQMMKPQPQQQMKQMTQPQQQNMPPSQPQRPPQMKRQQPPQQQQIPPSQPGVTQQPRPVQTGPVPMIFHGLDIYDIPVWPIKESDCIYPPPKPFQKPVFDHTKLPQALQDNINQNEVTLSSQALQPLQEVTGQQFYFFCDYYELMTHRKFVPEDQYPLLCTKVMKVLSSWSTAMTNWFNDIKVRHHPDVRYYVRKFLEACSTRHITLKLDIGVEKGLVASRNGRMSFDDDGVLTIFCEPNTRWADFGINYQYQDTADVTGHHPFRVIENALDERGCIESQLYYQKACKKYMDCKKLLIDTFGCDFTFEFDEAELFRNYDIACEKHDRTSFFYKNYVWIRRGHKNIIIRYFSNMVNRMVEAVTVNGVVNKKCVDAIIKHIPQKTIVLELEGLERNSGWYNLKFRDGKLVMMIHHWYTNMNLTFEHGATNKNCLGTMTIIDKIPLIAYHNLLEKANPIEEDCKKRLEKLTGDPGWKIIVNLPLTYKKLKQSKNAREMRVYENFPWVLMKYVDEGLQNIEKFNERLIKLSPDQNEQPINDDDDDELDSEEEEDEQVKLSKRANISIPFSVKDVLLQNIPAKTIQVKYLTKISNPIEPWVFVEMREGKMVIKIIEWNANRNTVLRTKKTGFGKMFRYNGCCLFAWMDYFEKQAKNEIVYTENLGKCFGTQPWIFDYKLGEVYQFVENDPQASRGSYLQQVGWQFMKYYEEVTKAITTTCQKDEGFKQRFMNKFGEKRTIRMTCVKQEGGGGSMRSRIGSGKYFEYQEDDGVLVMVVKQWLVNTSQEVGKIAKFC